MSRKQLQEIIRNLQEFHRCPSCGVDYFFDDIKVLGQIEPYCFVQLTCHNCSMPVLATVLVGNADLNKVATDLSSKEEKKFARRDVISAEEIADFHKFISGYKGSVHKLLVK